MATSSGTSPTDFLPLENDTCRQFEKKRKTKKLYTTDVENFFAADIYSKDFGALIIVHFMEQDGQTTYTGLLITEFRKPAMKAIY